MVNFHNLEGRGPGFDSDAVLTSFLLFCSFLFEFSVTANRRIIFFDYDFSELVIRDLIRKRKDIQGESLECERLWSPGAAMSHVLFADFKLSRT